MKVLVFYGEDEFSLREELAGIKSEIDSDSLLAGNVVALDGRALKPGELLSVCATMPFLGGRRLVIVEGLLRRFESGRSGGRRREEGGSREGTGPWKGLPAALTELPDSTTLVLIDGELGTGNSLLRLLAPVAETRQFPSLRQRAVPDWIRTRAAKLGLDVAPRAISLLAELVGNDLRALSQELEKLGVYAQGRRIEEEDVKALVSSAREASILAMVDAVVEGRTNAAYRLLEELRDEGFSSMRLLSMITRQYRHLVLAKELMLARLSPAEIGQRLEIRSSFALGKVMEQSQRYSMPQLEAAFVRLLEADASIKRGVYDEDAAIEMLLEDLAALSGRAVRAG